MPGDFNPEQDERGGWTFLAEGIIRCRMPKDGHYFDPVMYPLEFAQNIKDVERVLPLLEASSYFSLSDPELDEIEARAKRLYEETDFALVSDLYFFSLYQFSLQLFGYEKLYISMAADPEFVHFWMTFLTDALDVLITKYLRRVGQYTTAVLIADDYGQQSGPQISPQMFRDLLKREFGKDLVLWGGGVTAQTTLHHGTIDEIKSEVRQRLDTMKPGGGYIFSVDHDIQEGVSPEKIEAVFKTAQEHRTYG